MAVSAGRLKPAWPGWISVHVAPGNPSNAFGSGSPRVHAASTSTAARAAPTRFIVMDLLCGTGGQTKPSGLLMHFLISASV